MMQKDFSLRVCYADTDAAGFIHHARYLEFFERSRTEWLERLGVGPSELEGKLGQVLVIRETTLTFFQPGRLNDLLNFSLEITNRGRSQLTLAQKVYRAPPSSQATVDSADNLLVSATFHLVCVDRKVMKSTTLPDVISLFHSSF